MLISSSGDGKVELRRKTSNSNSGTVLMAVARPLSTSRHFFFRRYFFACFSQVCPAESLRRRATYPVQGLHLGRHNGSHESQGLSHAYAEAWQCQAGSRRGAPESHPQGQEGGAPAAGARREGASGWRREHCCSTGGRAVDLGVRLSESDARRHRKGGIAAARHRGSSLQLQQEARSDAREQQQ